MKLKYYLALTAMLLLTSCGQQHHAESLIKEFMNENLKDATTLKYVDFDKMDSTRHINDSIVYAMRESVNKSVTYKQGIRYTAGNATPKLIIVRVKYKINDAEYHDTYYLDDSLTRVIALKNN